MNELSRDRLMWRIGRRLAAAIVGTLTIAVSGPVGQAQTTPEQGTSNSAYTLHVYTDLLQVPTMVLTRLHGNYRALKTQNFTLSIDNGPAFHPVNARVQGDDPITLAILFDFTTDAEGMFTALSEALSGLPHGVLSRRDYISIYAYDANSSE